jgi:putative SOS response-associated peptidase YedK
MIETASYADKMKGRERSSVMCGRFTLFEADTILSKDFGAPIPFEFLPRYNIAPTQQILAVRQSTGKEVREAIFLRWGLIPRWAKDPSVGNRMINVRAETVAEKPAFRSAFLSRRCLVPSSGFYEWKKEEKRKQPYYIRPKDRSSFAFAGLWEQWQSPEGSPVESCALITTEANELISQLHDRMPVILPPFIYSLWLDPGFIDGERLISLLRSYPTKELEAFAVGTVVNNPKVDDPRCIAPANLQKAS